MAYKRIPLDPHTLPNGTVLRFNELEMQRGIEQLALLYGHLQFPKNHAQDHLVDYLVRDKAELRERLGRAFSSAKFRDPSKEEWVHYFRYKNIGVSKIVHLTNSSPHTIQSYKNKYPNFQPIFPHWEEFNLLYRWETIKPTLNLFNEVLMHTITSYKPTHDEPEQTPTYTSSRLLTQKEALAAYPPPGGDWNEKAVARYTIPQTGIIPQDTYTYTRILDGTYDLVQMGVRRYLDPLNEANQEYFKKFPLND